MKKILRWFFSLFARKRPRFLLTEIKKDEFLLKVFLKDGETISGCRLTSNNPERFKELDEWLNEHGYEEYLKKSREKKAKLKPLTIHLAERPVQRKLPEEAKKALEQV